MLGLMLRCCSLHQRCRLARCEPTVQLCTCRMCFQVQCINDGPQFAGKCNPDWQTNSITFMVTDKCPECQADQLDLNALAFQKVTNPFRFLLS